MRSGIALPISSNGGGEELMVKVTFGGEHDREVSSLQLAPSTVTETQSELGCSLSLIIIL